MTRQKPLSGSMARLDDWCVVVSTLALSVDPPTRERLFLGGSLGGSALAHRVCFYNGLSDNDGI